MPRNYYLFKVENPQIEHFKYLFSEGMVGIGMPEIVTDIFWRERPYREVIYEQYRTLGSAVVSRRISEFETFKHIEENDCIVMPVFDKFCIGTAIDATAWYPHDVACNGFHLQRGVNFVKDSNGVKLYPQSLLSPEFLKRIEAEILNPFNIFKFKSEIEDILQFIR